MRVHAANRSVIGDTALADRAFMLPELPAFWGSADFFVVSLPLTEGTRGLVGESSFAAMPAHAVLINVGRGPVVDETALFKALRDRRIAFAAIDTWYSYPAAGTLTGAPSRLPFHELPNLLMTPHMSGWTAGTIRRRQAVIADNVNRCRQGLALMNVVHAARA
jgi:phosphoglycerate dehydrogenase-like enzyme